jgi:hypothetical protein
VTALHALFELAEACVDENLALFGHVVFGVFAEVAEGDRFLDLSGQLGGELVLEKSYLFLQLLFDVFCHGLSRKWSVNT